MLVVDVVRLPIDGAGLRILRDHFHRALDRARQVGVVRVEIRDDGPSRTPPAFIDGVGLAAVTLGDPRETVGVFAEDPDGLVRGPAVHHQVLDLWIALGQHALDGFADEPRLIERGRDDRDERAHAGQEAPPHDPGGARARSISIDTRSARGRRHARAHQAPSPIASRPSVPCRA